LFIIFYLFASGSFEAAPVNRILKGHVVMHVKCRRSHMEAVPPFPPNLSFLGAGKLWTSERYAWPLK